MATNGNGEKKPERQQDVYQRNRALLQKYWLEGKRAIPKSIPKDAGIRQFLVMVEATDPTCVKELVRQCCGTPRQEHEVDINTGSIQPGQTFVVALASGIALDLPGAGRPAAPAAVPVPARARRGSKA